MNAEIKASVSLVVISGGFLLLARMFMVGWTGQISPPESVPLVDQVFTNTTTVRLSAMELIRAEEDVSGMDCYSCHTEGEPVELDFDEHGQVIPPKEHADLIYSRMNCLACHSESEEVEMEWDDDGNVLIPEAHRNRILRHGRSGRNNTCFNCHMQTRLDRLVTRQGLELELQESTKLCASCHGPTYQDWEQGIHGRTSGYWNTEMGPANRADCTSCHDPHAPAFPRMKPAPGPHPLHSIAESEHHEEEEL